MQVEGYINGTFNLVKNLPEEIAGLPKNVSPSCASHLNVPVLQPPMLSVLLVDLSICLASDPAKPICSCSGLRAYSESRCCMQVSDAVASQQQDLSQANNATYLMEAFHKLVHDLEEPVGVRPASYTQPQCTLSPCAAWQCSCHDICELLQWRNLICPRVRRYEVQQTMCACQRQQCSEL